MSDTNEPATTAEEPAAQPPTGESTPGSGRIARYFKVAERGSTYSREVRGGLVTFFTMAYIVVLNPIIIGGIAGQSRNADINGDVLPMAAVAAVTALVAGVMTLLMGLVANFPFAIAAGHGPGHQQSAGGDDRPGDELAGGDGPGGDRRHHHRDPRSHRIPDGGVQRGST